MKRAMLIAACLASVSQAPAQAQEQPVTVQAAHVPASIRPYMAPTDVYKRQPYGLAVVALVAE